MMDSDPFVQDAPDFATMGRQEGTRQTTKEIWVVDLSSVRTHRVQVDNGVGAGWSQS